MLTPYLIWIKLGAAAAVIAVLFFTGVWVKGAFAERDALRVSEKAAVQTSKDIIAVRNQEVQLREAITNAIKSIRITSNNNIQVIEDSPAPTGPVITLIPSGMPEAVSHLPLFTNNTTGRAGAPAEAR